jgi:PAS domain S-box-containing protein
MGANGAGEYATAVLEQAPVGITVAEPTEHAPQIVYANEQFATLTGYGVPELLDRKADFFQGKQTQTAAVERLRSAIADRERATVELRAYRKDGTSFWNRVRTAPLRDAGCVCFHEDVTEQRTEHQELRRQNERLESFAGTISHDLRSPLDIALTRIELAHQTDELTHLDDATAALERMETLIETVLERSRDDGETKITTVAIDTVAEDAWETTATENATLSVDLAATVLANESRLRQLFENVFKNAVEHGGDDVHVTVGPLQAVGTSLRDEEVGGFYVADDGPGLPAAVVNGDLDVASLSDDGLGLSIVTEIAEEHGWQLYAAESADGGARFEFDGVETIRRD